MSKKQSDPAWNKFTQDLEEAYHAIPEKKKKLRGNQLVIRPLTRYRLENIAGEEIDLIFTIKTSQKRGFISLKETYKRRR